MDDINGLQAYTIRKMDQYMPTSRDIEHYKLLSVHEQPLDNRQKHLYVLCLPTLFPNIVPDWAVWRVSSSFSEAHIQ